MKTKSQILEGLTGVKKSKKVDNNTLRIEYNDESSAIRLHNTNVVTFKGNKIILNSGGWRTLTTKDRINKFTNAKLYQEKGLWYLKGSELFYDGCIIDNDGNLKSKSIKVNNKKINLLKKQIKDYCDLITKDNLPFPNSGDCWYCSMQTENKILLGDATKNNDHLLEHLKEKYLHGSIMVNAMHESGFRDEQIGFHYQLKIVDTFKRSLKKYLQKRLIANIAVK